MINVKSLLPDVPASIAEVSAETHIRLVTAFITSFKEEEVIRLMEAAIADGASANITPLIDGRIIPLYDAAVRNLTTNLVQVITALVSMHKSSLSSGVDYFASELGRLSALKEEAAKSGILTAGLSGEIDSMISSLSDTAALSAFQLREKSIALENKRDQIVKSLADTHKDLMCMRGPLHMAAKLGYFGVVNFLLENGAIVNMPSMMGDMQECMERGIEGDLYKAALNTLKAQQITNLNDSKAEFPDFKFIKDITATPMLLATAAIDITKIENDIREEATRGTLTGKKVFEYHSKMVQLFNTQTEIIELLIGYGGHFTDVCAKVYNDKIKPLIKSIKDNNVGVEEPDQFSLLKWIVEAIEEARGQEGIFEAVLEAFDSLLSLDDVKVYLTSGAGLETHGRVEADADLRAHYLEAMGAAGAVAFDSAA